MYIKHFLKIFLLTLTIWCTNIHSQTINRDEHIILMLKGFYKAHIQFMYILVNENSRVRQVDSLQQIYCSRKLRKDIKAEFNKFGLDHDRFTDDVGADADALMNLAIIKDSTKNNDYLVTYVTSTLDPAYKPIKEKVIRRITVVKEDGIYKIDMVR